MSVTQIINFLKGKKTYAIALVAIVYGFFYKDMNAIIVGLTACGLRSGLSTEVAKMVVNPSPSLPPQ